MLEKGILVDCGKGNISNDAINYAYKLGLDVYRSDVTAGIISFVDQSILIKKTINNKTGRKLLNKDIYIVSGGVYGMLEDVVVDDFDNPRVIYGMADGRGKMLEELTKSQLEKIKFVSNFFKIK